MAPCLSFWEAGCLVDNKPFCLFRVRIFGLVWKISRLDDPVMWGFKGFPTCNADPQRWVLAVGWRDLLKNPILSYFFSLGKCIPITRGGGIYQEHMNEALDRLSNGYLLQTFPEGKVCQEDEPIRRLKWGTASLIVHSPIIPIVLPVVHHGFEKASQTGNGKYTLSAPTLFRNPHPPRGVRSDGEEEGGDNVGGGDTSPRPGWGSSIRPIYTFSTVEEFWRRDIFYNNLHRPSRLAAGAGLHCFKNRIEPKWEDPVCAPGGKWTMTFPKSKSDTCWLYTVQGYKPQFSAVCVSNDYYANVDVEDKEGYMVLGTTLYAKLKIDATKDI
ncbi:hypothetical protein L2E82_21114 [Cichorium intybus]|uniref:Uncharacterized protein n=1 Tax=Cichorium intybus TaxID=13427 RepID=A0ACB9DW62_CICIN|nr:hypothetical protein L2E82_21114 [Cichorium intybus]